MNLTTGSSASRPLFRVGMQWRVGNPNPSPAFQQLSRLQDFFFSFSCLEKNYSTPLEFLCFYLRAWFPWMIDISFHADPSPPPQTAFHQETLSPGKQFFHLDFFFHPIKSQVLVPCCEALVMSCISAIGCFASSFKMKKKVWRKALNSKTKGKKLEAECKFLFRRLFSLCQGSGLVMNVPKRNGRGVLWHFACQAPVQAS